MRVIEQPESGVRGVMMRSFGVRSFLVLVVAFGMMPGGECGVGTGGGPGPQGRAVDLDGRGAVGSDG